MDATKLVDSIVDQRSPNRTTTSAFINYYIIQPIYDYLSIEFSSNQIIVNNKNDESIDQDDNDNKEQEERKKTTSSVVLYGYLSILSKMRREKRENNKEMRGSSIDSVLYNEKMNHHHSLISSTKSVIYVKLYCHYSSCLLLISSLYLLFISFHLKICPSAIHVLALITDTDDDRNNYRQLNQVKRHNKNDHDIPNQSFGSLNQGIIANTSKMEEPSTQGLELYSVCNSSKACSLGNKHSICANGSCQCKETFLTVNSTCIYTAKASNFQPEHMLPIMIVLAIMFIGICIAMNLFSRARFKKQRNAFIAGRVPKRQRPSIPVSIRGDQQLGRALSGRATPLGPTPSPQPQMC